MHHINALPAFQDNYIWCVQLANKALVIDPGDPEVVQRYLQQHQLQLVAILITHHHWDHVDGVPQLQQLWPQVQLYLPTAERQKIKHLPENCRYLADGDVVDFPDLALTFQCISTPGHTLGHLCYLTQSTQQPWLFCGDTLFSGGCGRLFEGTPQQMFQSLQRLTKLPPDTSIFCTHEYTLSNLKFAQAVEPDAHAIVEYFELCQSLRQQHQMTLPSTLKQELAINPFLRCHQTELQQRWQQADAQNLFTFLRDWKNRF